MDQITIEGNIIHALSPEGQEASMTVEDLLREANRQRMSSRGVILPDGIKYLDGKGPITVWVHETPPRVYSFKWIANDSPARYGPRTKYRTVRIGLPYLVVLAVFDGDMLSSQNECFFRTRPLEDDTDELFYPALLNCSKFTPQKGKPLSWICTARLDPEQLARCRTPKQRMRVGFGALMHCLLEAGFNYSSEEHEGSSWFTESAKVDRRVSTVEKWEKATEENPLFVLDVEWLTTGMSLRQVIDRIYAYRGIRDGGALSEADLARMIFNHRRSRRTKPK